MAKAKLTTRQKESKKINRKRKLRKWWQTTSRRFVFISIFALLPFLAGGCWWLSHSGKLAQIAANASDHVWQQTARMGFKVENIYLEGRHFTPMEDVTKAINAKQGEPILALSLADMRARLEAIPRVKYAEVARVLPGQLHIHIVEREPVAVWQNEQKLHLIDQDGVVMEYIDPNNYKQLLLVVGENAPQHTQELMKVLALEPDLAKQVVSASYVGERRWNISFKNNVELKLPELKMAEAWQNFARLDRDDHLLSRAISSVDMRLSDRVFIKTIPTPAALTKTSGSET